MDKNSYRTLWGGVLGMLLGLPGMLCAENIVVGNKPDGWVERAIFTSQIQDREPVDEVTVIDTNLQEIQFFTELRQLAGRTVTHRWEYEGEVMAEVRFEVGGPRWRVFSKKGLLPSQTGKWTVVVVDESGWALHAAMFDYRPAAQPDEELESTTESAPSPQKPQDASAAVPAVSVPPVQPEPLSVPAQAPVAAPPPAPGSLQAQ